ncbi:MAG: hypothetical protein ABR552_01550, partial [Actinomycetota bacterium]
MIQLLLIPIVAPAVAALACLVIADTAPGRASARWTAIVGFEAAIGTSIGALVRAIHSGSFGRAGFAGEPWRIGLSLAVLVVTVAGIVPRPRAPRETAAILAAASAGAAMPLAYHAASASAFVFASVAGALGLVVLRPGASARAVAMFAAASVGLSAALFFLSRSSSTVPLIAHGAAGAVFVAVVAVLGGVVPSTVDARDADPLFGTVALGVFRVEAVAVAVWIGLSRGVPAQSLMIGGAVAAMIHARRAARTASAPSALAALTGLVFAAIGSGSAAARDGAVLLAAGLFLATVLLLRGRAQDAGAPEEEQD